MRKFFDGEVRILAGLIFARLHNLPAVASRSYGEARPAGRYKKRNKQLMSFRDLRKSVSFV